MKPNKTESSPMIECPQPSFGLNRTNYVVIAIAYILVIVGFILMCGPSSDKEAFEPDIFSFQRIVVAPAICLAGFILIGFGIIFHPRNRNKKMTNDSVKEETEKMLPVNPIARNNKSV